MGASLSRLLCGVRLLLESIKHYDAVATRLARSPGLPSATPTRSFWTHPPAEGVATHRSPLPAHADVVVIGSGITGTSVARALLMRADAAKTTGIENGGEKVGCSEALRVVMLEAREACSGATGRNGGHIAPDTLGDHGKLVKRYGSAMAAKICRFRLAHLPELMRVAEEEEKLIQGDAGREGDEELVHHAQLRMVDAFDVYLSEEAWWNAREQLELFQREMPAEGALFRVYEKDDAIQKYNLSSMTVGCIAEPGGAIHPYRFVTRILARLLKTYDNFHLLTSTPCTSIHRPTSTSPYYTVETPLGSLTTSHVIHCTNGYASHLLTPMRNKIVPVRGTMTAQRPGRAMREGGNRSSSPAPVGALSFVFQGAGYYDYLTQLPTGEQEVMLGGGLRLTGVEALEEVGVADDGEYSIGVAAHLGGALPVYFSEVGWGAEGETRVSGAEEHGDGHGDEWPRGRVKALWTGIMGFSADGLPWVGRIPGRTSGQGAKMKKKQKTMAMTTTTTTTTNATVTTAPSNNRGPRTAPPGEWIAAGYSGHGMVQGWMCGKAVAHMVLGESEQLDWLPEVMLVSEQRWRRARIENLADEYM